MYGVSHGSDQVGSMVSRSVLWWEDVVWNGLWLVWGVWFVVLESFFLRVEDLWQVYCGVFCSVGYERCEVFYGCFAKVYADYWPSSTVCVL